MEVDRLEREFLYNGVKLPDTTPTMTPEQVRDTYTHLYPEMATAAIEGPETVAGKLVYKFVRAIGAFVAPYTLPPGYGNSAAIEPMLMMCPLLRCIMPGSTTYVQ
jgi:PRTRC genetic system protein C